jgi:hypothetical protein
MYRPAALALVLVALQAVPAAALDVDACGTTVSKKDDGVLVADLVCDLDAGEGVGDAALELEKGAELDMNGHTLTVIGAGQGIRCERKCAVKSTVGTPGEIVRGSGSGYMGITAAAVRANNLVIRNDWSAGILAGKRAKVERTSFVGNGSGLVGGRLIVGEVSATGGGDGLIAFKAIKADTITVSDNSGWGVDAGRKMRGTNVIVTNNGQIGIDASAGASGHGGPIRLEDSTVTGNSIDLYTPRPPKLDNTTCDVSVNSKDDSSWGICAFD